jgi:hypothetical protein
MPPLVALPQEVFNREGPIHGLSSWRTPFLRCDGSPVRLFGVGDAIAGEDFGDLVGGVAMVEALSAVGAGGWRRVRR